MTPTIFVDLCVCVCVCVCVYVCVYACMYVSMCAGMYAFFISWSVHTYVIILKRGYVLFWYWITKAYDVTCATGLNILMYGVTLNFTPVPNLLSAICARNWVSNSKWVPVSRCKQIGTVVGISNEYSQALKRHKVFEMEVLPNSVAADYSNITHLTDSLKDLWTGIASPTYFMII